MNRILTMVVAAIMTTMNLSAQSKGDMSFCLRAGGILSTLTNNDDAKQKLGWGTKFELDYHLSEKMAIALVGGHDYIGYKSKSTNEKLKLDYLCLGPIAKYYVMPWFSLHAGPEIGFLISAKMGDTKVKDDYKPTEFSLPFGFSIEPSIAKDKIVIDLTYRPGLSKANKVGDAMHNRALMLSIGYRYNMF
ncbi:MAG: PorT family protein [Prevotella sp.]|nr:PorT family protein [Prevotella sp.]